MDKNPLLDLETFGQSIWLDFLRRSSLENGGLQEFIDKDGASGLTSNPSIFEKAIAGSHDYDHAIRALVLEGKSVEESRCLLLWRKKHIWPLAVYSSGVILLLIAMFLVSYILGEHHKGHATDEPGESRVPMIGSGRKRLTAI